MFLFIQSLFPLVHPVGFTNNSIMEAGQVQWRVVKLVIDLEQSTNANNAKCHTVKLENHNFSPSFFFSFSFLLLCNFFRFFKTLTEKVQK